MNRTRLSIRIAAGIGCFILAVIAAGCASYAYRTRAVDEALLAGDYNRAQVALDDYWLRSDGDFVFGRKKDSLLYYLDLGIIRLMQGDDQGSFEAFQEAEELTEKFAAKSVSREAGTWLLADQTTEYAGEPFEQVHIDYYQAVTFMVRGMWDEALVECRQVYIKLNEFIRRFGDKENRYSDDAFIRYLMGICYEAAGNLNDAYIAYREAERVWRTQNSELGTTAPPMLYEHLIRIGERLGFDDDLPQWRERYPDADSVMAQRESEKYGEIIVLVGFGSAPYKESVDIVLPGPEGPVRVSVPEFRRRGSELGPPLVRVGEERMAAITVQDISTIAVKNLEDRLALNMAKIISRTVAKQAATRTARKESDALGLIVNIASIASENADTRSWLTLPHKIAVARVRVVPGTYPVSLRFPDAAPVDLGRVTVGSGEKVAMHYRTFL